ncbi:MAG: DUF3108 domain-containing protein [Candidatus Cloacimonetes bacterium]|nr:DUF3108 domain-containing protein [Candidatus Cloacimonadota bacterium]
MRSVRTNLVLLLSVLFCAPEAAERIKLSITYLSLPVVRVEISDADNQLKVTARSTALASLAHKMDNEYTVIYQDDYLPVRYRKQIRQSDYQEDRETSYDRNSLEARRISFIDPGKNVTYEIKKTSRDFFSALYYLRNNLETQGSNLWLDAGSCIWEASYRYLGTVKINSCLGRIECLHIKLNFKKINPDESERSDMLTNNLVNEKVALEFWLSNDQYRIPVKAKFQMKPFPVIWRLDEWSK